MKIYICRFIFVVALSLLSYSALFAQGKNEYSFYVGSGLSALKYDMFIGDNNLRTGGVLGLGYTRILTKKIGFTTGVELAFYNAEYEMEAFKGSYMTNDGTENFIFQYVTKGYKEKQHVTFANIPIMLQYQTGNKHQFYTALGGKVGIPVSSSYRHYDVSINSTGYYPEEDLTLDAPRFKGFGPFTDFEDKGDWDVNVAFMLSAEVGMKWRLTERMSLYSGVYADYGLNDLRSNKNTEMLIQYNLEEYAKFITHSALESHIDTGGKVKTLTDKVIPMAIGIKVKLSFMK